jgi:hypothetical protein
MFTTRFSDNLVSGSVRCDRGVYVVEGQLFNKNAQLFYRAPEPSDLRRSIAGSALPFANPDMAFGPINSGQVKVDSSGSFKFQVFLPNSYYEVGDIANGIGQGKLLSIPRLTLTAITSDKKHHDTTIKLNLHTTLRSLTSYPGKRIRSTGRNTPTMFVV